MSEESLRAIYNNRLVNWKKLDNLPFMDAPVWTWLNFLRDDWVWSSSTSVTPWGQITWNLGDQTDLQSALDLKASSVDLSAAQQIYSMSDLPTPVAWVITLTTWTYQLNAALVTSDAIKAADWAVVNIFSDEAFLYWFVYTWTWTFLTWTDFVWFTHYNIFLSAPNWTLYGLEATAPLGWEVFSLITAIVDCKHLWTIKNMNQFYAEVSAFNGIDTWLILDTVDIITITTNQFRGWNDAGWTLLTIQWTVDSVNITSTFFKPNSTESVIYIDPSITISWWLITWNIFNKDLGWSFFKTWSINQSNKYWKVHTNTNVKDSGASAEMLLKSNSTVTSVWTIDTPAIVDWTWTSGGAERFTTTASGRGTYAWLEEINLRCFANPSAVLETWTNKDITFYFSKWNDTNNTIASFADAWWGQITVTTDNAHWLSNLDRVPITGTTNYNGTYTITNIAANTFEITDTFVATETWYWQIINEASSSSNTIASTTKASSTPTLKGFTFVTGDFIELFVENNTDWTWVVIKNTVVWIW